MLRIARTAVRRQTTTQTPRPDADIVEAPVTEAGPGGTWWRVTVKEAPRYVWSSYAERPHPRGIDIDHQKEHDKRAPEFTKHFDDIPDHINPQKVQPFLEYRNTALGNAGYSGTNEDMHELYWRPLMNHRNWNLEKLKEEDDIQWRQYKERNGISPDEYMTSETYARRYGGKCTEPEAYVWSEKNYFRRFAGQRPLWKTKFTCWYHDANELHQTTHSARNNRLHGVENVDEDDRPHYRFEAKLQGTYACNHPCPCCRDWKLLINYKNTPLLNQFVDGQTGRIFPLYKTNLCQFSHARISQAIDASRLLGHLSCPTVEMKWSEWNMDAYKPTSQTPF
jgi:ribosomal protein S18